MDAREKQSKAEAATQVHAVNFVRAESDTYVDGLIARSGGIGRWDHHREPAAVDAQTVIRMNRDTLYSSIIVDVSEGATLSMPEAGARYQTAMVVDQDHYIAHVFDEPGEHELTPETFPTSHIAIAVRTLVDPQDAADIQAVRELQDRLTLEAPASKPFGHPAWDKATLDSTRNGLLGLARGLPSMSNAFGSRESTDPIVHLLATAAGWGGLPSDQAIYEGVEPGLPVGHYALRVGEVPVRAFWSISVYNHDGFFEPNELNRYSVNSVVATPDADGTVTINFGGDPDLPNQIPIMDGWNYVVRLYQPGPEIIDGTWQFPQITSA